MAYDLDNTKNKTNYTTKWWIFKIKRVLKKFIDIGIEKFQKILFINT